MDLNLNEQQEMLKKSARELLQKECPKSLVRAMEADQRGFSAELWKKMANAGWMGLILPEKFGGSGQDILDMVILLEEVGRAIVPAPFTHTVVLSGSAIAEAGTQAQKSDLLPRIAKGDLMLAYALVEPGTTYEDVSVSTKATAQGTNYTLSGTKMFVPYANVVDYLLVVARTGGRKGDKDGVTLFLVDASSAGIKKTLLNTRGIDHQFEVKLTNVQVPAKNVLGKVGGGWALVDRLRTLGAVAQSAEIVGQAQQVMEFTVEYAKNRVQFGRPIGSFQAIAHRCSDMLVDVDGCRYITYEAAWRLSQGLPPEMEVAMAKAYVSDAYRRIITHAHQVHGAIGFTEEHDLPLYSRRSTAAEVNFGDAMFYREIVAQKMGL